MARVSRGELAPTALQDLLSSFVQAQGSHYASALAEVSTRFFTGLVDLGTAYVQELVAATSPELAPGVHADPPRLDGADWTSWIQQLNEYAGRQAADAADAYQGLLDRIAAGDVPPSRVRDASSALLQQRLPEHLRRLVGLCFELLDGLDSVRAGFAEEYLTGVLSTTAPADEPAIFALDLRAALDETASAQLSVTNTRDDASLVSCRISDVRRADGVGPAFAPQATISPAEAELAPGEKVTIELSLLLSASDYEVGPLYVGELHVSGHDEVDLEVPLRIHAVAARFIDPA